MTTLELELSNCYWSGNGHALGNSRTASSFHDLARSGGQHLELQVDPEAEPWCDLRACCVVIRCPHDAQPHPGYPARDRVIRRHGTVPRRLFRLPRARQGHPTTTGALSAPRTATPRATWSSGTSASLSASRASAAWRPAASYLAVTRCIARSGGRGSVMAQASAPNLARKRATRAPLRRRWPAVCA